MTPKEKAINVYNDWIRKTLLLKNDLTLEQKSSMMADFLDKSLDIAIKETEQRDLLQFGKITKQLQKENQELKSKLDIYKSLTKSLEHDMKVFTIHKEVKK